MNHDLHDLHDLLWEWCYRRDASLLDDEEAFERLVTFIDRLMLSAYRMGRGESYQTLERNRDN